MAGFLGRVRKAEHRFCQENLSPYLDGHLNAQARHRVDRHLHECQDCRQELESLRRTVELVRALPRVRAPRSFRIPHAAPAPSLPVWMRPAMQGALRWASGVAAALLLVALAGRGLAVLGAPMLPQPVALMMAENATVDRAAADVAAPETQLKAAPAESERSPEGTPSGRGGGRTEATAAAGGDAYGTDGAPTLTAEEATRAAAAPPGMGEGPAPEEPAPSGATEVVAAAAAAP